MTPAEFDAALSDLGWKGTDFCTRAGLVPNTVWRWRKGQHTIPEWVPEYLGALLELQRLHARFVAVRRPGRPAAGEGGGEGAPERQAEADPTAPTEHPPATS